MKVIDLLNMVANGEIDEDIKYQFSNCDYCTIRDFFNRYIVDEENLNLEIIGDTSKEDNKIEKLDYLNSDYYFKNNTYGAISNEEIVLDIKIIENYINKLIDRLNGEDNDSK